MKSLFLCLNAPISGTTRSIIFLKMKFLNNLCIKKNQALVVDENSPEDVARAMIENGNQAGTFFIYNIDKVYNRIELWKKLMPRIKIFYAMKSNDYIWMLKIAVATGCGFDCASPGEINKALRMNISPKSIIYAAPVKTPEQMMFARAAGVHHTTFDTASELKKIKEHWPEARLLIRIKVESDAAYKLGEKFGCDPESEASNLLDIAANMGLKIVGVAFHVGSLCSSLDSYKKAIQHAHQLFEYEKRHGRQMTILDIGGGFLSDRKERIFEPAAIINKAVEELFPDPEVQIIAEPGRYLCDSAMTLYTNIINVKRINKEGRPYTVYYINDGIYGSLRATEIWHEVKKFEKSGEKRNLQEKGLEDIILYGPTCDSTDMVMENRNVKLPRCTPYDWLVFKGQGAYTYAFTSDFSSLPRPQIRVVVSKSCWKHLRNLPEIDDNDFITRFDISEPLPSSIDPPYISDCIHYNTPELHVS